MSDDEQTPRTTGKPSGGKPSAGVPSGGKPSAGVPSGPQPEEIRFFGTTWVDHSGGYALRRAGLAVGSLAAAVAACFVLRFAYEGLQIAAVGGIVNTLVVIMFAVCSAIAFRKTWEGFGRRPTDPAREESLRSLKAIGFIGSLLAYSLRCLREAPGEALHRTEHQAALTRHEKRRTRKNPKRK